MEHITTKDAAEFVANSPANVAATITAHHLLYNRNAIFQGGVRPHWYCLPVLKRETHREALVAAAISGNPKFFLGTDSAPHAKGAKEAACGCAGCYTAYAAIELYAEAFEQAGALDKLEAFASFHGPDWYGLPRNSGTVTLARKTGRCRPITPTSAGDTIVPLRAGETCPGKCAEENDHASAPSPAAVLAAPLLTACVNDGATYEIDNTREHVLSLIREQPYFWDSKVNLYLVVSRMPACMRRHSMGAGTPKRPGRGLSGAVRRLHRQGGKRMYATETQTCESFAKMDSEPAEGMGKLMGTFRVKKGELVFVKEEGDEAAAGE
jgi:hypothetical protein